MRRDYSRLYTPGVVAWTVCRVVGLTLDELWTTDRTNRHINARAAIVTILRRENPRVGFPTIASDALGRATHSTATSADHWHKTGKGTDRWREVEDIIEHACVLIEAEARHREALRAFGVRKAMRDAFNAAGLKAPSRVARRATA